MKMNDALFSSSLIVGVAGGTGSGKSTLVEMLLASDIGEEIALLPHDHYYLSWDEVPTDLRESQNWDHPDAIDNTLYVQHLDQLARGQSVPRPNYCFETYRRKEEPTHLMAKKILLVEGILVLAIPEIRQRLGLKVFVEASSDERLIRRVLRDTQQRGRSLSSVVQQYRKSVKPMHDTLIQPSRDHAHIVLPNTSDSSLQKSAELLCGFLRSQLDGMR